MGSNPINVDDSDLNDIDYQTPDLWSHQQAQANYNGGTYSIGFTSAQAEFTFNGTEVAVYGVATPNPAQNQSAAIPPSISFAIDGGIPITVVSDPDLPQIEYSHQFYDSRTLPAGEHVLQMNVTYSANDWPFVLDYIQYTPLPPPSPPPRAPAAPASGSAVGHAAKSVPVGAIAGSVAGSAVVVAVAALARWYTYSRKRPAREAKKHGLFVYPGVRSKLDLLDPECKLPPPSPASTEPSSTVQASSADADWGRRVFTYSLGSAGAQTVLYPPKAGSQYSYSDSTELEFAPASRRSSLHSHDHYYTYASVPSAHYVYQPFPAPPSTSSYAGESSRPGTPASSAHQPLVPPPAALHRPGTPQGPAIVYRAATPDPYEPRAVLYVPPGAVAQSRTVLQLAPGSAGSVRPGPSPLGLSKQAEAGGASRLFAPRPAPAFHADSGVRFGGAGLGSGSSSSPATRASSASGRSQSAGAEERGGGPSTGPDGASSLGCAEQKSSDKWGPAGRVSFGGSAISEVPPMYTES